MGNNQNTKLDRKFSSLPPSNFPSPKSESSFIRKITRATRRKQHNVEVERRDSADKGKDWPVPFVDALFFPEYPLKTDQDDFDFEMVEVIARGAFGDVIRVQRVRDQAEFAMKVMKKSQVIVDGAVQQCKDEATIQDAVGHHPFIVKPYYFFQSRESVYIVMDYIPRGELFAAWRHLDSFGESLVKLYIAELAMVLDYLHNSCIIYRDLKMENILIDAQGHLQVIDFGLAKWLRPGHRTGTICGTLQYIAPEVLSVQPYGHTADWWSLGILMYALLTGEYPVNGACNHLDMAEKVKGHVYELPTHNAHSWRARDAIKKLLQFDPNKRVTDLALLQQLEFFQDVNFDALLNRQLSPNIYLESEETFGFGFREQELLRRRRSVARSVDGELDVDVGHHSLRRSASVDWDIGMERGSLHDCYISQNRTVDMDWSFNVPGGPNYPPPKPERSRKSWLQRSASVDLDIGRERDKPYNCYVPVPLNQTIDVDWSFNVPGDPRPPPKPERARKSWLRRSLSVDLDMNTERSNLYDDNAPVHLNQATDVDWSFDVPSYPKPPPKPERARKSWLRRSLSVDMDIGTVRGNLYGSYVPVPLNQTIGVDRSFNVPDDPKPEGYVHGVNILWNESVASLNASFV